MPKITFLPNNVAAEVEENTKVLVAARRHKVPIRFGCAACSCGTCAVKIAGDADLSEMRPNEAQLLAKMKLTTDGSVRLSCQARIIEGELEVDLDFQDTYSPDQGLEDD